MGDTVKPGMLIDTHAHLCDSAFDEDRSLVLKRAREAGVAAVLCVSENLAEGERNLELATEHSMILPAAGLFPAHLDPLRAEAVANLIRREQGRVRAIGEVGLDYWLAKDEHERNVQREIFTRFIDLAIELDLPLNVHSRSAGRHAIELLLGRGAKRVQLHAFDGKAAAAAPAVEAGFFFSIPPSIVRSPQKQKLVRFLPLENIILETDSPVLGPTPEERNEPAMVRVSLDAVTGLKALPGEEVLNEVYLNTERLYGSIPSSY
jgi:TatD DNase family protein